MSDSQSDNWDAWGPKKEVMNDNLPLMPCPFCGHVGLDFNEGSTFRWLAYSCGKCGMGSETRMQTLGEGTKEEWRAKAERNAIKEWNTRAALAVRGEPVACPHDWAIWPETDGLSQRCRKCGEYRDTPEADKFWKKNEVAPQAQLTLTDEQIDAALEASDWPKSMLSPFVQAKMRVFARAVLAAAQKPTA